ncbi:ABC transporter substrate-binding protein [Succinivibrio dextrinosolvens]|uniref:ABC transporter substrate-binding protein n=1 Tax=Succinivibrio dextrinosolvens TaxID=83771 RepID=UPI0024202CF0|nr:ABC transporter substrate-binding protein [Succinivibrio dextrinosolvens]MBE6421966.1 ABC transporter substrate-binding protein [Succinivibrio dextrinosolvens]
MYSCLKRIIFGVILLLFGTIQAWSFDLPRIKVTMLMEHEGFLMWYAVKNGFDKKVGVNIDLTILDSNGIEIMNRHREDPSNWNVTCVTSIPLVVGTNQMPLEIVGIANDESNTTGIYTKSDSDLLKVKGWNEDYPDVYGSPETIKGKTFAIKTLTSGAYMLVKYLEIFNLDFSDIKIVDLAGKESIKALERGDVDAVAIWSPDTYHAESKGFKLVSTADDVDAEIPMMFLVDKEYCEDHEDVIAKMLAAYLLSVEKQIENPRSLTKDYQKFLRKYSQLEFTKEFCEYDILRHSVIPLETQLKMFERKGHGKSSIQRLEATIASSLMLILYDSHTNDFAMTAKRVKNPRYVTDRYLKQARRILLNLDK